MERIECEKCYHSEFEDDDKLRCRLKKCQPDYEDMREAEEIRRQYKTLEIDHFEKFFAVKYPPRECDGYVLTAMVGIYNGMLFWKEDVTYQFLEEVKNIEKAYDEKVFKITHNWWGEKTERDYEVLSEPLPTKRLYYSKSMERYSEANYVLYNP